MGDDEKVILGFLGGLLGYQLGKNENKFFEPFQVKFKSNYILLKSLNIRPAYGFFAENKKTYRIFWEGIMSFLFGFHNSGFTSIIRVLELCLRSKYREIEKKEAKDFAFLINWAEEFLKDDTTIVHHFRNLRNYIHTDKTIENADCLEAIRHTSILMLKMYPDSVQSFVIDCQCGQHIEQYLTLPDGFVSDTVEVQCNSCHRKSNLPIPLYSRKHP